MSPTPKPALTRPLKAGENKRQKVCNSARAQSYCVLERCGRVGAPGRPGLSPLPQPDAVSPVLGQLRAPIYERLRRSHRALRPSPRQRRMAYMKQSARSSARLADFLSKVLKPTICAIAWLYCAPAYIKRFS